MAVGVEPHGTPESITGMGVPVSAPPFANELRYRDRLATEPHGPEGDGVHMGRFIYEQDVKVEIEDRALAHLQATITAKLRRGEPFVFSWREDASVGGGRTSVWIHPGSSIVYKYYGGRQPALNRAWVEALAFTANTPVGLYLVPEPAPTEAK